MKKNRLIKRGIVFAVICLFIGSSVTPTTGITVKKKFVVRNMSYLSWLEIRIRREVVHPFFVRIYIKNFGNETFDPSGSTLVNIVVDAPKMLLGRNTTRTWKPERSLEPNESTTFKSGFILGFGPGIVEVMVKSNDSIIALGHSKAYIFLCFVYTQYCNYTYSRYNFR
ncbi:MAG: hypothetical protein JSW60_04900 [Thermoplasmatales archaeon]|nr:MAG: hypothetical protein JSW60_04900 [Thermoplasmatales archaeon]